MTTAATPGAERRADRRLAVAGALATAGAIGAAATRSLGAVPESWAVAAVLAAGSIALGLLVRYLGTWASVEQRARVATRIATVGLALSALAVATVLPGLTRDAGWSVFGADVVAQLCGVSALFLLAAPGRTLGWRVALSMGFVGFLAVPAMARVVGVPMLARLGEDDPLGHSLWVPLTENFFLMLPVLVIAIVAARRPLRPAALDAMLLGAWAGLGFALNENALYGRGGPNWGFAAPLSWLFPSAHGGDILDTWWFGASHLVAGAAMGVGVGISALYRHRYRWALLAAPVMYVVTVAEHSLNNLIASQTDTVATDVLQALTLRGTLSSFLLLGAAGWLFQVERTEALSEALRHGLFLRPAVVSARMTELGRRQRPPGADPGGPGR